jgi:Uma2 family endonuclease
MIAEKPVAEKTYTRDEFLNLPDSVAYELIDGHLVERHVSERSSWIGARIIRLLGNEADNTGEACVYGADLTYDCFPDEPRTTRRGDVSLIRAERLKGLDDPGYMPIPADLIVEVISPNDNAYDVERKVEKYLNAGFGLVWVVYPDSRTVLVYRPDGSVNRLHENDEITGEAALPSFRCKVAEFFRRS